MTRQDDDKPEMSWTRWYRFARYEMQFRYGMKGIPVDVYKTQWALGHTPQEGCRVIANEFYSYGRKR